MAFYTYKLLLSFLSLKELLMFFFFYFLLFHFSHFMFHIIILDNSW